MKNIKIITLLILLFGFASAYSQQSSSGAQKSEPAPAAQQLNKVERSVAERPVSTNGSQMESSLPAAQKSIQGDTPASSNAENNPGIAPPEKRGMNKTVQTTQRTESTGPNPGQAPSPGTVKPEIK